MSNGLIVVRPDQDWARSATFSATSEQEGYLAAKAGTDDPSEPWWADSTTATLTATLGATRSIDTIALIMTNAGHGEVITVDGLGVSPADTLTGVREASGYPRDLVLLLDSPVNATELTFSITSNIYKWSIGRVVIGLRTQLAENVLISDANFAPFRQVYNDVYPDFRHNIPYDIGVEGWSGGGTIIAPSAADQVILDNWWFSTLGGNRATLIVPHPTVYPPLWCYLSNDLTRSHQDAPEITRTPLRFSPLSRGLEVVG